MRVRIDYGPPPGFTRRSLGSDQLTGPIEMPDKLRRFLELPARDKYVLLSAWFRLARIDLAFRILPFARARRLLADRRDISADKSTTDQLQTALRVRYLVSVAANHHWCPMRCLPQSLAARDLLAKRGIETILRIGVQRTEDSMAAHAWLEYEGEPLGEPEAIDSRFRPLIAGDSES